MYVFMVCFFFFFCFCFFFQAEDGIRDWSVTGVQTCALPIYHDVGQLIQPLGQYYNPYMAGDTTPQYIGDPRHPPAGGFLAMAPQLTDGRVEYLDGTEATIEQIGRASCRERV